MLPDLPTQGQFAVSQVLPLMRQTITECDARRAEWRRLADLAAEAKAQAKKIRADTMIQLRLFGAPAGGGPIKTNAERNEWADGNLDVQAAEQAADLAAVEARAARESYEDAQRFYTSLMTLAAMERDEWKRETHD